MLWVIHHNDVVVSDTLIIYLSPRPRVGPPIGSPVRSSRKDRFEQILQRSIGPTRETPRVLDPLGLLTHQPVLAHRDGSLFPRARDVVGGMAFFARQNPPPHNKSMQSISYEFPPNFECCALPARGGLSRGRVHALVRQNNLLIKIPKIYQKEHLNRLSH